MMRVLIVCFVAGLLLTLDKKPTTLTPLTTQKNDTINVGYAYWWPQSGPFLHPCSSKNQIAFAFTGTVIRIDSIESDTALLYFPQTGCVKIDNVLLANNCKHRPYEGQKYFKSDCFYQLNLKGGDQVLVTCYSYENGYAIPGGPSVLKIDNSRMIGKSFKNLMNGKSKSVKDSTIWTKYNLKKEFLNYYHCKNKKRATFK